MDKEKRITKIYRVYERVQRWIQLHKGTKSPSEMNVAQAVLRELEEMTIWVEKQEQKLDRKKMIRLNQYWKDYKS